MAFFRFLDLPREVRNLVYAECAKDLDLEFNYRFTYTAEWAFSIKDTSNRHDGSESEDRIHQAALLGTCRQFRMEMLEGMAQHITLRVEQIQAMSDPASTLREHVPSEVCQSLTTIALDKSDWGDWSCRFQPSAQYRPFTEWLFDAFPQLQHVSIRDSTHMLYESNILTAPAQVYQAYEDHRGSEMPELYAAIEDVYDHYRSKGLGLELCLRYRLGGPHMMVDPEIDWLDGSPKNADDVWFDCEEFDPEVFKERGSAWWGYKLLP